MSTQMRKIASMLSRRNFVVYGTGNGMVASKSHIDLCHIRLILLVITTYHRALQQLPAVHCGLRTEKSMTLLSCTPCKTMHILKHREILFHSREKMTGHHIQPSSCSIDRHHKHASTQLALHPLINVVCDLCSISTFP